ncbi:MAG: radical SAM protein [Candidatus Magnetoglobus multicellularis str. Araruama]|uniref:Radical SAM protein n=1 Tax=Candidatus Magnetoglobus multicellularis str. Araruama TaxID=890399 RepID=A0A1V1PCK2_9BACT|nr:MAG: radical SAM protein [Candidatus Magnetoglobus multicellularis str. Araruama]
MKIALVIPKNGLDDEKSFYDYSFHARFLMSRKYISYLLAIPTLAALTPDSHDIVILDENIEDIDYSIDVDLVGISVRTMFATRAYHISNNFQKRGVKTVLGGIHPSMCPDEAALHCDSVVIGEAENIWEKLLSDLEKGQLMPRYQADGYTDMTKSPTPDRRGLSRSKYLSDILQTAKGCPFRCEFCSVHAFDGQKIRTKTVEQVIQEIDTINATSDKYKKKNAIFFADDNILSKKSFAISLFKALKAKNINWMCQASINISQEENLLQLMKDSGCGAIFIGFESISQKNLSAMDKGINRRYDYVKAINTIQSYGILVHSSFIVGYEFDTVESFDELIHFIQDTNLLMPLINILTPFPGTQLFKRLDKEGRIMTKDWQLYDTKHVVFKHQSLTSDELQNGYKKIVQSVYSFDSILKKMKHYWQIDFWKHQNNTDPVKFKYRLLFAMRLSTLLLSTNVKRSRFIIQILPFVFRKKVRISTILVMMGYNDFAQSL